jgi:hypothetical protein
MRHFPNGEKTHFIEKIWSGIVTIPFLKEKYKWNLQTYKEHWPYSDSAIDNENGWGRPFLNASPKIHTFRTDELNRWKPGIIIHFKQWTGKPRQSKQYQFAPLMPCISTQKAVFENKRDGSLALFIDDREIKDSLELNCIAINDGFKSANHFFEYFNNSRIIKFE